MITIQGDTVSTTSPEGKTASMPLEAFLEKVSPQVIHTGEDIIPDGVKAIRTIGNVTFVVHESSPQIYNLKWIRENSPKPYGQGATYRNARIALPYMYIIAAFNQDRRLLIENECFFRIAPLTNWEDDLLFPALLNCSAWPGNQASAHRSWICTQHLNFSNVHSAKHPIRAAITALHQCLIGTGFNRSSENHEGSSWYEESKGIDERISTIAKWEEATVKDPLFVLDVPWLKTNHTLKSMCELVANGLNGGAKKPKMDAAMLAKYIFSNKGGK